MEGMRLAAGLCLLSVSPALAQQVAGRVIDSSTGEALARVRVEAGAEQDVTNSAGEFVLRGLAPGEHRLQVSSVGYRPFTERFTALAGESKHFEVSLHPETLRHSESITVNAGGVFAQDEPTSLALVGNELKNLASVLADDPLRAVQALPGVVSNDDFQSQFAIRGAPYERVGIYLDGVLLHSPFHGIEGEGDGASLTLFNGDILDSVSLHSGAPPPLFGDRTAGALDARTREGDRERLSIRGTASASNAGALAEGPFAGGRGSWLAAVRKSYLQYIIERTAENDPAMAFGFSDAQGRINYDMAKAHNVSLSLVSGRSGLDRTSIISRVGLNSLILSDYRFTLANLAWRYAPAPKFMATNRLVYMRERFENENRETQPLAAGGYGEWTWQGDAAYVWRESATLAFGGSMRRLRDDGFTNRYLSSSAIRRLEQYRGSGVRSGIYLHQSWSMWNGRLQFAAGGRGDHSSISGRSVASPYASAGWQPRSSTRVQLSWGQYSQFPEIEHFFSLAGHRALRPQRAMHVVASIEQRLDDRTRIRMEFYNRQDRDLLFRPQYDPRIIDGQVFTPPVYPPIHNSQTGYARGVELMLQRRTANGVTGWIAYSYGRTRVRDGILRLEYPADYDQRHSVTSFLSYRLRPTVNVSGRAVYGSGLPLRGFLEVRDGAYFLAANRNQARLPYYQRTDVRVNKVFVHDRWQVSLFAEVVNIFNRRNVRLSELDSYNATTGSARPGIDRMLPVLPSAGVVVEF
jgi:hypothetical protein